MLLGNPVTVKYLIRGFNSLFLSSFLIYVSRVMEVCSFVRETYQQKDLNMFRLHFKIQEKAIF